MVTGGLDLWGLRPLVKVVDNPAIDVVLPVAGDLRIHLP